MSIEDTVAKLRELLSQATPGPWIRSGYGYNIVSHGGKEGSRSVSTRQPGNYPYPDGPEEMVADAALIVAAVNALPRLLQEIERLQLAEAVCNAMTAMDVRLLDYDAAIAYEAWRAARPDAAGSDEDGAS